MKSSVLLSVLALLTASPVPQEQRTAAEPGREPGKKKFLEFRVYVLAPGGAAETLSRSTAALRVEPKGAPACVVTLSLMRPQGAAPIPSGTTGRQLAAEGGSRNVVLAAIPPDALDRPGVLPDQGRRDGESGPWAKALSGSGPYFKADLPMPSADLAFKGTLSYTLEGKTETLTFDYPFPPAEGAPGQKPSK